MSPTIEIAYVDMPASPALTLLVQTEIGRLARHHAGLEHCRVTIASPHQGPAQRLQLSVVMDTDLGEVTACPAPSGSRRDAYAIVRDVFDAAGRKLAGLRRGARALALIV